MAIKFSKKQISEFYDTFSSYQKKTGPNIRVRTVLKKLKKAGLKNNSKILEIGCGVGTLTGLMAKFVRTGKIVSTDISPECIRKAKGSYSKYLNIEFITTDMADFSYNILFDFIVLADVLEHIPMENHPTLFNTIRKHIHENSIIAINIPSPNHIEWLKEFKPDLLQIIDQPIHLNILLNNVYANDLYLDTFYNYSLFHNEFDYQWIILKPNKTKNVFTKKSSIALKKAEIISKLFI